MTYDEGHWLMFAALANAGFPPYTVTFVGIPPLALLAIQWGAKLFGLTLGVRYPMMLFSLLGIGSLFLSFRPWKSSSNLLTGLLAAIFLSFDLDFFRDSTTFMGEVPATSMAILSFVLAQQYYRHRRLFWLTLSGVAFGLSLALKLFMVFFPILIGVLLVVMAWQARGGGKLVVLKQLIVTGTVWVIGIIIPWLLFFAWYDPAAMYKEVFLFRLAFREVNLSQGETLLNNSLLVAQMLFDRLPLVIAAVAGVVIGWRQRRLEIWSWFLWLILALGPLIWQSPLRQRYAVMLLPPLAALGAVATVFGLQWLLDRLRVENKRPWIGQTIVLLVLMGIISMMLLVPVNSLSRPPDPYTFSELNPAALEYVASITSEGDCIVTDDQRFAFAVNRLVPATLSETAQGRLATGWLTTDDIIKEIEQRDCPAVVYVVDYFSTFLPDLAVKLRNLYFLEITYDRHFVVYAAKKNVTRLPQTPLAAQFGQYIQLKGADLTPTPWPAGQRIHLATYWSVLEAPDQAYKILVQLRNNQGETAATADYFPFAAPTDWYRLIPEFEYHYRVVPSLNSELVSAEDIAVYPARGLVPTKAWPVGDTIRDVKQIELPNLPAGTYNLYLGMYDPETLTRLTVQPVSEDDLLRVGQVEITGNNP